MAIVMRAVREAVDDDARFPRSATMHFLRVPEVGPVTVSASVERAGRSLTTVTARLEQGGKLLGIAIAAYSAPWESPLLPGEPAPEVAPPEARKPVQDIRRRTPDDEAPQAPPAFTEKLTMQHRFGEWPFSGAERGETGGWMGLIEERPIDELTLVVLADAWFPAPWPRLTALAPAPTVDLTVHFRAPLPFDDTLLIGNFTNSLVRDGFFDEDGRLWAPDGTLVAQSRQLGILIGPVAT